MRAKPILVPSTDAWIQPYLKPALDASSGSNHFSPFAHAIPGWVLATFSLNSLHI